MTNETSENPIADRVRDGLEPTDAAQVRHVAYSAELLTTALGLPKERKYEVLSALGKGVAAAMTTLAASKQNPQSNIPMRDEIPQR